MHVPSWELCIFDCFHSTIPKLFYFNILGTSTKILCQKLLSPTTGLPKSPLLPISSPPAQNYCTCHHLWLVKVIMWWYTSLPVNLCSQRLSVRFFSQADQRSFQPIHVRLHNSNLAWPILYNVPSSKSKHCIHKICLQDKHENKITDSTTFMFDMIYM